MDINKLMMNFRDFLLASWPCLYEVMLNLDWDNDPYFLDEWIQSNWELLVEKQLFLNDSLLLPYGYNKSTRCRIFKKDAKTNYAVMCQITKNKNDKYYLFNSFLSKRNFCYELCPPFDYVDVKDTDSNQNLIFPISDVFFLIKPI